jgi:hypothetical protein
MICQHILSTWHELAVHVWRSHPGQLPLAARQAFKDHAPYLRNNITKITGHHHAGQDVVRPNDMKETACKGASGAPSTAPSQSKPLLVDNATVYKGW